LQPLCEGLLGGSSVEEGVGQPARVPYLVMEWMATITGDHVGYPGFQKLIICGAKICMSFGIEFCLVREALLKGKARYG
jgi:hypothetical protein